jgi:hypothetical protein
MGCWEKERKGLAMNNSLEQLIESNNPSKVTVIICYLIGNKSFRLVNLLNQMT